jgi:hypothetical protein
MAGEETPADVGRLAGAERSHQRTDTPPVVIELVAQADIEGARIDSVVQISVWRQDQSDSLAQQLSSKHGRPLFSALTFQANGPR